MKEITMSDHLRKTVGRLNRSLAITGLGTVVAAGLFIVLGIPVASIPVIMTGAAIMARTLKKRRIVKTGIEGETMLRKRLREILNDDHTAIFNVPTNHGDIDCVLLGPEGIYAIEVKNHKGIITYADNAWRQIKTGRKGTSYEGGLKNPSSQLFCNIAFLKKYLKRNELNQWINGLLVFTHPEAVLSIEGLQRMKAIKLDEIEEALSGKNGFSSEEQVSAETHILRLAA